MTNSIAMSLKFKMLMHVHVLQLMQIIILYHLHYNGQQEEGHFHDAFVIVIPYSGFESKVYVPGFAHSQRNNLKSVDQFPRTN